VPRLLQPALLLCLLWGCRDGDSEVEKAGGKRRDSDLSAADLYRDYAALRGGEVLEAYAAGVTVSGTVAQVLELGEEGLQIWLAADGGSVALGFADSGAVARSKGVRPGTVLRARCQVGGKPQEVLFLKSCVLF
jgi:hypothetical protein